MKKNIFLFWMIFLLASCTNLTPKDWGEQDKQVPSAESEVGINTTNQDTQIEWNWEQNDEESKTTVLGLPEIIANIPSKYNDNSEFRSCVERNIDSCISETASILWETVTCDDFVLESNRNSCTRAEISQKARDTKNTSLCDSLESWKESCLFEVIVAIGKENFDVKVCEQLPEEFKIDCNNHIVHLQALDSRDTKICERLLWDEENLVFEKEFCSEEINFLIEEEKREIEFRAEEQKRQEAEEKLLNSNL